VEPVLGDGPRLVVPEDLSEPVRLFSRGEVLADEAVKRGDGCAVSLRREWVAPASWRKMADKNRPSQVMSSIKADHKPFLEPGEHAPGASCIQPEHERGGAGIGTVEAVPCRVPTDCGAVSSAR
jgi:hypothetical protein